jgi:hypothetical protein
MATVVGPNVQEEVLAEIHRQVLLDAGDATHGGAPTVQAIQHRQMIGHDTFDITTISASSNFCTRIFVSARSVMTSRLRNSFVLPLLEIGNKPMARRRRSAESYRFGKPLAQPAMHPHVTHATVTPLDLADRQIPDVVRNADAMRRGCEFELAHAAE